MRKPGKCPLLAAPYGASSNPSTDEDPYKAVFEESVPCDVYQKIADEYKVTRQEVKLLCFPIIYQYRIGRFEDLLDQMREQIRMAISAGIVKRKSE